MLRHLYNALWYPALPVALALTGGALDAPTRRARMGLLWTNDGASPSAGPRIWAHAASVGEVGALRAVVTALVCERPGATLVVTTMTAAGLEARGAASGAQAHARAARFAARCVFSGRGPSHPVDRGDRAVAELLHRIASRGARVAIINSRISERVARYRYVRPLLGEALASADLVLTQTEDDSRRFIALGAAPSRVIVTGNTKFDLESLKAAPLRPQLESFAHGCPVLIAGSTAPGEEQIAIDAWRELRTRSGQLALVLAPRHLERVAESNGSYRRRVVVLKGERTGRVQRGRLARDGARHDRRFARDVPTRRGRFRRRQHEARARRTEPRRAGRGRRAGAVRAVSRESTRARRGAD